MVLTYPLMTAVQLVSAQIGRVTGCGLAKNIGDVFPKPLVLGLIGLLFIANTINIGANLAAMGASAELVLGWGSHVFTVAFALISLTLQLFIPYERYARYLKWLTLVLLAYVAVVFVVKVVLEAAVLGLVAPPFPLTSDSLTVVVAIFGTTISPYLMFWQGSQEVEEIEQHAEAHPLKQRPAEAPRELQRIRLDTFFGMAISNIVAIAIMISAAATLHAQGKTDIATAAEAAEALRPIAGDFAFALFSLGIIGTGLLSLPVLAGSAAYAFGEAQGWKCGLENKPWEAVGFYSVIAAATLLGIGIDFSPLDPIKALFWSAVINGFVAVPVMAAMMWVGSHRDQMGRFTVRPLTLALGWVTTAVMAVAALAMLDRLTPSWGGLMPEQYEISGEAGFRQDGGAERREGNCRVRSPPLCHSEAKLTVSCSSQTRLPVVHVELVLHRMDRADWICGEWSCLSDPGNSGIADRF